MSYAIKNNPIKEKHLEQRYTYRGLVERTVQIDPKRKGISTMTLLRSEKDIEGMTIKTLLLICNALGISPRSFFTNSKGE